MVQLHIITVATESKYYYPYLVESCKKNNYNLTVLGFGEKWKGFNWRLKLMREYLQSLPSDDIVCFVDGYDVLCVRDLSEMICCFNNIKTTEKCKIIVGYDNIKNHALKPIVRMYFGNSINAGTYIGTTIDILNMLNIMNKIDSMDNSDDQVLFNKYYNMYKTDIYIDKNMMLFATIINGLSFQDVDKYYTIEDNNLYVKNTSIKPFFIHAPNANFLNTVLIKLNYSYDDTVENNLKKDYGKKVHTTTVNIINKNKIYIIIIIIIILLLLYLLYPNHM